MVTFLNIGLIFCGMIFLANALLSTKKILRQNSNAQSIKIFKVLMILLQVFFVGYTGAIIALYLSWFSLLESLVAGVFLFGGAFTSFAMLASYRLIHEIKSQNENLELIVFERTQELLTAKTRVLDSARFTSIGRMAGGIAHEINNPLTVIQGMNQLLHRDLAAESKGFALSPYRKKCLDNIATSSDRVHKIIESMRTLASSPDVVPMEDIDLGDYLTDTVERIQKVVKGGLKYKITAPGVAVNVRKEQFKHCVTVIVENAADAVLPETKSPEITGQALEDGSIEICFRDYGHGVEPEHVTRIFDPFFSTRPFGQGVGLGLSTAKSYLAEMGATIELVSLKNPTEFRLVFKSAK